MAQAPDDDPDEVADPHGYRHDDAPAEHPAPRGLRRRGIYLLPNLFTTGVLFCGFFAIVQAMQGRFDVGCIAIFVAMVLDGMDWRVARWTNTQSEFGAQHAHNAATVADRLGLLSLDRLEAHAALSRDGEQIRARGRVKASLKQACAATGEPVPEHIDEPFDLRFVRAPNAAAAEEEMELSGDELDTIFHDGSMVDLGGAIAEGCFALAREAQGPTRPSRKPGC